jgi:hypothetical protein
MISDRPTPFLFIHIPKTGGSSIEDALVPIATPWTDIKDVPHEAAVRHALPAEGHGLQHKRLSWFNQQHGDVKGRFVFSVVRNPFDRAISQVHYLRTYSDEGAELFKYHSWTDNLLALANADCHIWGQDLGACQVDYLTDMRGDIRCDFVARFENLATDWCEICRRLGASQSVQLPNVNSSGRFQPYREFFSERAAAAIYEKYKRDCEAFDYSL